MYSRSSKMSFNKLRTASVGAQPAAPLQARSILKSVFAGHNAITPALCAANSSTVTGRAASSANVSCPGRNTPKCRSVVNRQRLLYPSASAASKTMATSGEIKEVEKVKEVEEVKD